MAKPHASLSPVTNIFLIFIWGTVACILVFVVEPHAPPALAAIGAALGVAGGFMQHLSLREATNGFTNTSSLLDVRRAFKSNAWGSRYIAWRHFCTLILIIVSFFLIRQPLLSVIEGWLAGYMSFMFARELVTLRDTFYLRQVVSNDDAPGDNGD